MPGIGSYPGERRGGRKKGALNKRTVELQTHRPCIERKPVDRKQIRQGISPLNYMLAVMHDESADQDRRDRMAMASAPYLHPRLHSVEAKTETTVIVATADERRERARQAILEAFAERPMLTVSQVIEHDAEEVPIQPADSQE